MGIRKIALSIVIFLNILFIFSLIFYNVELDKELGKKDSIIQNLKREKTELQNKITLLKVEIEKVKLFLQNISEAKESELRNPSWEELKNFLEIDNTNELIYNESFDCSGFAIELFKRARINGLRCGFVEIEFEENKSAHTLNAFQTIDKGLIFIDVTGNEEGTGRDEVAYIKVGKPYGTIKLNGMKEKHIACNVGCSRFAKELSYVNYPNIFDYNYFLGFKGCKEFYEECGDLYNKAVEEYNRGSREYTYSEIQKWLENLEVLKNELVSENFYFISESDNVKHIQIYW